jgi:sulfite reductase (ferredoxin)
MQSFRSELEDLSNPIVEKDIVDLAEKISLFRNNKIDEEKFRSLRLARGVYGQRQPGVQMVRIKIPYGKLTTRQLRRIADISDEYASSALHATTRQDIQIHYVNLDRTPELWAKLEKDKITLREACGNTVRNITASAQAGIDPDEPFDVSPYAHAMFEYFLRNPVCQEMGRKFKIAFSSSEKDSAFVFIHDLGFIPVEKSENGVDKRGFKVYIGGGLGSQPFLAQKSHDFLAEDEIIPFTEALLRVFDRYGERARRQKARLKFLVQEIGLDQLLELVNTEYRALSHHKREIDTSSYPETQPRNQNGQLMSIESANTDKYQKWLKTNVFRQKQAGYYGVFVKVLLGNISSDTARKFADIVDQFCADDIRITVNQGYLLKYVTEEHLPGLFNALDKIGLAQPGFDSTTDITACPGTDTCNLGISSSTGIAAELEKVLTQDYPELINNNDIKIKISGCPNSCGQHGMASIGFHGSSIKNGTLVLPALQIMLGGGVARGGEGHIAERIIKIPSKRGPQAVHVLLNDYQDNALDGEYYMHYYQRMGKKYFYELLKPLTQLDDVKNDEYIDWGRDVQFKVLTAVGECAGVIIDLVATLLFESDEKQALANETYESGNYSDSIYHSYAVFINSAKAMLLDKDVKNNSHMSILRNFDKHFIETGKMEFAEGSFEEHVLRINKQSPSKSFAAEYKLSADAFLEAVKVIREDQLVKI